VAVRSYLLAALLAQSLGAAPCAAVPRVECASTRHDYGVRLPGALPPAEFAITNRGQDPLTLKAQPCCGLTLKGATPPIPPGATRKLVVAPTFPLGDGSLLKTVRVLTNDPDRPELLLEVAAVGKSVIQVFPSDELTVSLLDELPPPQTVLLRANYEAELKLTSLRSSAPFVRCQEVKADVPEGDDPQRYRAVQITIAPDAPGTPYEAVVAISTSCKAQPLVKLKIYGLSPSAVTAQPPRLDFGEAGKQAHAVARMVTLTRAIGPFKVLDATASDPRMALKVMTDPSGLFAEVVATFQPGPSRGPFRGTITLRTDDPERPRLVIPYAGEVE
jgi:hypothetical protein